MKSPASGGWAGTFGRIVGGVVFGYAALVLTVGCVQRKLIYHPPGLAGGEQDAVVARTRLQPWTNGAGMRIGWWRPGGSSLPGSVLVVHGNAGAAAERAYLLDPIQQATGLDVFVLEYPGFAGRPGKPSQATLTAAADEGLGILCSSRMPVYVVGESLGTGVAAYLAGHHPENVRGVVLLTPFNSLTAAAGHHYPWLPVRWLLMDPYPSETWLASYPGPVGVVVGPPIGLSLPSLVSVCSRDTPVGSGFGPSRARIIGTRRTVRRNGGRKRSASSARGLIPSCRFLDLRRTQS